jgi:L-alanine-DL-glutamate epimerase-like enolase superfamily enzyme
VDFDLYRLKIPLLRPYRLSFGPVAHLDTLLVRCRLEDREGWGEATLLTGYTDETIEGSWQKARQLAESLPELAAQQACTHLLQLQAEHPFTATAFCTAIEMAQGAALLRPQKDLHVPILGLLNAGESPAIEAEMEQLLAAGYRTIKVKVGFDPMEDAKRVRRIQRVVNGRVRIRLDANQGYSATQAREFLSQLLPDDIELFEQPCAAGDWVAHRLATVGSPGPGMVDQYIKKQPATKPVAQETPAQIVKLKFLYFVSVDRLARAIEQIRELGMTPVLGNGVASDIGCWMEACVAARHIDNAGEMNGFLKPAHGLLRSPLQFKDGCIHIPAGWQPEPDQALIDSYKVDDISATHSR